MADDSLPNRKMLGRLLRSCKYEVTEAVDGQDAVNKVKAAIDAIATHPPDQQQEKAPTSRAAAAVAAPADAVKRATFDLITMDFEMPVMNGPDATRMIHELGFNGPVVGVSGNVLPDDLGIFQGMWSCSRVG